MSAEPPTINMEFKPTFGVYAADIISSLYDLFNIDVPLKKQLSGEVKNALLEFLLVLKELSPLNKHYERAFGELADFLKSKAEVTSDEWNHELERSSYPNLRPGFVGCKGSSLKYRGYPCGLWTLFHSLTVSEALKFPGRSPKVPHAMNRLIAFIFSCTECGVHFATATSNVLNPGEPIYPEDTRQEDIRAVSSSEKEKLFSVPKTSEEAVLWLNKVHNKVNMRLKGTPSEDPMVPKVIFPTLSQCLLCFCELKPNSTKPCEKTNPTQWDHLLEFLVDYYNPCNWNLDLVGADVVVVKWYAIFLYFRSADVAIFQVFRGSCLNRKSSALMQSVFLLKILIMNVHC
ncbi:Sulfhydryl oxidase 1 [Cichlidogyrus casuarinus]|uniref:Sulfhydryl oxidase n=1 Tax=Cichlidogyrus casuarinus TaxID=1844966 RepID=A0ABD2QH79_9PLAT